MDHLLGGVTFDILHGLEIMINIFDMAVAVGLLIFMTASDLINLSVSIVYVLGWIFLFWRFGILSMLGKLFQAPIYGWFIIVTFQNEPLFGWLMVIFLLLAIIFTWPRFPQATVPSFISGFDTNHSSSEDHGNLEKNPQ
jgi:hypothetical protein